MPSPEPPAKPQPDSELTDEQQRRVGAALTAAIVELLDELLARAPRIDAERRDDAA